ncbi:MAG: hypothetical protein GXO79_13840 [Chlorobi bacterium]|nr:hypothetical protein [Chlorobiota bacterium]
MNFKLSFKEKLQLKVHKMMCDACNNYEKQSIIIDKELSSSIISENIDINLDQLKNQIKNKLSSSLN